MIGTLDISTDIKWQEQQLWILLYPTIANDWGSGYFCWPIMAITGILDTRPVFWQQLGLKIRVLASSGNFVDSGYLN